jgi:hypothetical protein
VFAWAGKEVAVESDCVGTGVPADEGVVARLEAQHDDLKQGAYYLPHEDPSWDATADAVAEIRELRAWKLEASALLDAIDALHQPRLHSSMKCGNCKFWDEGEHVSGIGTCTIELPPYIVIAYRTSTQMETFDTDGCDLGQPRGSNHA